jgi:hypothetical protein
MIMKVLGQQEELVKDREASFGGIARWMWWSEEIVMPSQLSILIVVSVGLGACLWAHRRPTRRMKRELGRSSGVSSMSSTHETILMTAQRMIILITHSYPHHFGQRL